MHSFCGKDVARLVKSACHYFKSVGRSVRLVGFGQIHISGLVVQCRGPSNFGFSRAMLISPMKS